MDRARGPLLPSGRRSGSAFQPASRMEATTCSARDRAEHVVASIREAGWKADPDLRPEGKSGPLARSMASYLEYWQRWAQTWEFQSLLRARFVAGDESL